MVDIIGWAGKIVDIANLECNIVTTRFRCIVTMKFRMSWRLMQALRCNQFITDGRSLSFSFFSLSLSLLQSIDYRMRVRA